MRKTVLLLVFGMFFLAGTSFAQEYEIIDPPTPSLSFKWVIYVEHHNERLKPKVHSHYVFANEYHVKKISENIMDLVVSGGVHEHCTDAYSPSMQCKMSRSNDPYVSLDTDITRQFLVSKAPWPAYDRGREVTVPEPEERVRIKKFAPFDEPQEAEVVFE